MRSSQMMSYLAVLMISTAPVVSGVAQAETLPRCTAYENTKWCIRRVNNLVNVRVLDTTSSTWPITQNIYDWNVTPGVDVENRLHLFKVNSSQHVGVYEARYGTSVGWLGLTTYTSSGGCFTNIVTVRLNDSYTLPAASRRHVSAHELGHAFGLGHTYGNHVMNSGGATVNVVKPSRCDAQGAHHLYP